MEVAEFQARLEELCRTAKNSENQLTQKQLREAFDGLKLERDQLLKILKYLKMQGVEIEGAAESGNASSDTHSEDVSSANGTRVPLTLEEKDYLREYLADISAQNSRTTEDASDAKFTNSAAKTDPGAIETAKETAGLTALFSRLSQGDDLAMAQLTQRYLPITAQMAAEMNCAEIALPDLIQEANVGLLTALSEPEPALKNDLWLRARIRRSIAEAIDGQTQQKFRDDCLVARVEKLESAVRDLTDEDGENRFSLDELAVILDMNIEEIRDILKLTGDDQ